MPFYFTYGLKNGVYRLSGEGEGNKQASAAAFEDLKNFPNRILKC